MVAILYLICGVAGMAVGGLLGGIWFGLAGVGQWTPPTPDQIGALALLCGAVGALGAMILTAIITIFDW